MCSLGDDIPGEEKFMKKPDIVEIKKCNKCRVEVPNVLLRSKDGYCKTCFLSGTVHKFKAFLGKHRFINKNDHVLVNFSFGHPVTSLLHLLQSGINVSTPKQLKFYPTIIYVERHYHLSIDERKKILEDIHEYVQQFNFKIYFVSFIDYIVYSKVNVTTDFKELDIKNSDTNDINKIFHKKANATIQTELYKQFQHQLLIECAKQLKCQHIFMCDLAINVASQILIDVALGRGSHLELDIGICDRRNPEVNIIKPLRNFDIKELALYNFFNNIEPLTFRQPRKDPYSSVQNLMTNFVQNLQINFPSTITTVVRTGDKLSVDTSIMQNEKCTICLLPIENKASKLKASEATDFSHWLSTYKPNYEVEPIERYNEAIATFKENEKNYCYACSKIAPYLIKE